MPAAVTPIRPALAPAEITRWRHLLDPHGRHEARTWDDLFAELEGPPTGFLGEEHPGWSAAVFDGDRRAKAGVVRVTAAVLDYDGTASVGRALETWAGHFGLVHATRRHRDEAPRFRVVLPLRRAVSAWEWETLWQRLQDHCDGASDPAAKDASRFWFWPGSAEGAEWFARRLDGDLLDPDVWLRRPPKVAPAPPPAPRSPVPAGVGLSAEERASRYVATLPGAIAGQNGHGSTWKVALVAARGFALDEAATLRILRQHNATCRPPWSERELVHKARSAADANVPLGYLLEKDRPGWTPQIPRIGAPAPAEVNEDGEVLEPPMREPGDDTDEVATSEPVATSAAATPRTMADLLGAVLLRAQSGARDPGVSTCHYMLDHLLAGFRPKMITVLGARTSFGKSSYAIMVADEALRRGDGVLLVSAEDGEDTYGQRFMARRARVNAYQLRANNCEPPDIARMAAWTAKAETVPFFVDAIGKPSEWIAETIRRECAARQVKLVIVDYLQRISATKRTQDKRTAITEVMVQLSDAIKGCNSAGLVLSQLKRLDGGTDREPGMSDLKESGDIENMAEHVVLGWLSEEKGADANDEPIRRRFLKVEKNKDGPVDTRAMTIDFEPTTASFRVTRGEVYRAAAAAHADDFDDDFTSGERPRGGLDR